MIRVSHVAVCLMVVIFCIVIFASMEKYSNLQKLVSFKDFQPLWFAWEYVLQLRAQWFLFSFVVKFFSGDAQTYEDSSVLSLFRRLCFFLQYFG